MTTGVSTERPESAENGGETGTLLLTVLAAATLTAARSASNSYPWLLLAQSLLAVAGPLAIVLTQRRFPATRRWWDRWLPAVLAVWCLWPLASESVLRLFSIGEAHELVMLVCLQNAALVLSVYSHRRRCQQTACLLGGFLVLFAVVIESGTAVGVLAANVGAGDERGRQRTDAVIDPAQLQQLQHHVSQVPVSRLVQEHLVALAQTTREHREVTLGLSPRGLITWQRVAQARAHLQGRDFVIPDDVQHVARPVLEVRLAGNFDGAARIVEEILAAVPVPVFGSERKEVRRGR